MPPAVAADATPAIDGRGNVARRRCQRHSDLAGRRCGGRSRICSGTHEMPTFATPNKIIKATPAPLPQTPATPVAPAVIALPAAPVLPAALAPHPTLGVQVAVPPSPPLIEELRRALAAAERRIEELNERARIADVERAVAIARANEREPQLREQLAGHLESLHTASGRLAAQRAEQPALEDELFARAARIDEAAQGAGRPVTSARPSFAANSMPTSGWAPRSTPRPQTCVPHSSAVMHVSPCSRRTWLPVMGARPC